MGILKQVPEVSLGAGAAAGPEVLLRFTLVRGLGQQPPEVRSYEDQEPICYDIIILPGSVVSVLAARLQVQVVQCPVLELLAEILDADLQTCRAKKYKVSLFCLGLFT